MESSTRPVLTEGAGWEEKVVYWTSMVGIYLMVGVLFFYSAKEKLFDGGDAPAGIVKQFSGTFIETVPGVDAAWTILGILEAVVFLLILASIVTGEFLPNRRKKILQAGLAFSVLTFAVLATGQNVTGEVEGVASLYLYAAGSVVFMWLVRRLSPGEKGITLTSRNT